MTGMITLTCLTLCIEVIMFAFIGKFFSVGSMIMDGFELIAEAFKVICEAARDEAVHQVDVNRVSHKTDLRKEKATLAATK